LSSVSGFSKGILIQRNIGYTIVILFITF